MPTELELTRAALNGLKTTLERLPAHDKKELVTRSLAEQFNGIVKRVGSAFPDLSAHLPKPIGATTPFRKVGKADATYVEVEVYCEQLLNLLQLMK